MGRREDFEELCVDVAAASQSASERCLGRRVREVKADEDLTSSIYER